MERTFSIRKLRLVSLVYLSEIPFFREKFRTGRQINLFICIPSEISGFWGVNCKQLKYLKKCYHSNVKEEKIPNNLFPSKCNALKVQNPCNY